MKLLKTNKNFALLFYGSFVSEIGNSLYNFAVSLYILSMTGSSSQMAIFLSVSVGVRLLFSPLAGVLVDKLNKIKIIYFADYIRALLFLFAGVYMFFDNNFSTVIVMLYLITIISSVTASIFSPAVSSAVPEITGVKDLQEANSNLSIINSIQSIFGILLGAIIYGFFGLFWILILNAFSFFVSAISEMFIHPEFKSEEVIHHESDDHTFKEGLRYIKKRKGLLNLLVLILFLNFAITPLFSIGVPYLYNNLLLRSPVELALTEVIFSASMLIGGLIIGNKIIKSSNQVVKKSIFLMMLGFILTSIDIFLVYENIISFYPFYFSSLLINAFMGIQIIYVNIPIQTGITIAIEPQYRGRVFSITGSLTQVAVPFAFLLGGYITEQYSVVVLAVVCSVLIIIPSINFLLSKKVKQLFDDVDQIRFNKNIEVNL